MKPVVLDTNILLDIFVFNDKRAQGLKNALMTRSIEAMASTKTIEEFVDVIARPIFKLPKEQQLSILHQWKSCASMIDESALSKAPWICEDIDDQIFLDIAFTLRPAIIISKDNALLKIASKAMSHHVLISNDYQSFNS